VKITVHRPELELSPSLAHLDLEALSRAPRAEFEVGYIQTGDCRCCRRHVLAVVRRGMVVDFRVDACDDRDAVSPTPELVRVIRLARRRVAKRGARAPRLPIPVRVFVSQAALVTIGILFCFQFCMFGFCVNCCQRLDIDGDVVCGRIIIDTTVPS
jgi:hypothetical protein